MSLADLYYTKDATGGAFKTEVSGVVSSPGPHPTGALLKVNRGGKSYFIKGGSKNDSRQGTGHDGCRESDSGAGGAGLWFYDIGFRCDMVYLEPVPDTEVMVLTVRKNRKDCNPDEDVCPVKFRCLVERERFFHDFRKALSQKVSDPSLQKWMVPRVNWVFAMGMDREERLARVRKAEERVAGREPHGKDSGKVEWYEVKIKCEEMEYLAAVLREVNMIRQDPWAMGEPLPEKKLEEFVE